MNIIEQIKALDDVYAPYWLEGRDLKALAESHERLLADARRAMGSVLICLFLIFLGFWVSFNREPNVLKSNGRVEWFKQSIRAIQTITHSFPLTLAYEDLKDNRGQDQQAKQAHNEKLKWRGAFVGAQAIETNNCQRHNPDSVEDARNDKSSRIKTVGWLTAGLFISLIIAFMILVRFLIHKDSHYRNTKKTSQYGKH